MEISDDALIQEIRGGKSDSFAEIVERYKTQIYNLMYRYSGSAEDAADMSQDVFCRAFERLGQYRNQKSFFAWLYTLALNYARDWARKRNTREHTIATFARESADNQTKPPESLFEADQEVKGLVAALAMLAEDRREIVLLKYRHERSIKEIAEIFGISESAVKMRLYRALDELGQKLKN
ncbi:MAG: sigma-70 family RNA polymerase sigma factor [Desulfocapsaceae bacterium]